MEKNNENNIKMEEVSVPKTLTYQNILSQKEIRP
jgi:hypothetical protein